VLTLARSLLARAARQLACPVTGFTPHALDILVRYPWPGNVRELENAIERACALAIGPLIDVDDLPDHIRGTSRSVVSTNHVRSLEEVQREYILGVLAQNHGNKAKTAEQLRIAPATLFRRLRQYGRTERSSTAAR
jgi:DNA-binding NtrC family response regulator